MMLSRTGWGETSLPVAFQTVGGRRAPWGCAAGAPYWGTASPPPLLVLCCVVLCGVVLCCVVLCCVMLCCVVLCCVVLCVLCCVVLCCLTLCCVVLGCVALWHVSYLGRCCSATMVTGTVAYMLSPVSALPLSFTDRPDREAFIYGLMKPRFNCIDW